MRRFFEILFYPDGKIGVQCRVAFVIFNIFMYLIAGQAYGGVDDLSKFHKGMTANKAFFDLGQAQALGTIIIVWIMVGAFLWWLIYATRAKPPTPVHEAIDPALAAKRRWLRSSRYRAKPALRARAESSPAIHQGSFASRQTPPPPPN
jgi:hypothetical protein